MPEQEGRQEYIGKQKTEYEFLGVSVSVAMSRGHHERMWNVQTDLGNLHDLMEEVQKTEVPEERWDSKRTIAFISRQRTS